MSPRRAAILAAILLSSLTITAQDRVKEMYARALDLESRGNHPAALSLLWEAAGLAPRDADIQQRLGEALERAGAVEAAIDAYRAAIAERPSFGKAANNLILALVKVGKGSEAIERARALVAQAPDDPDRLFTLGLAQSEQDVDQAIKTFGRVLELAPRHTLARYNLALVLKRADRFADAAGELRRAIQIDPRPEAYYTLGVIHWQQGDLGRAENALRAAVAAEPGYAEGYFTLGAVLKAQRDFAGAAEALRRAIALRPELASAHYTLAQVLQQSGDENGARRHQAEAEQLRRRTELEQEANMWTSTGIRKLDADDAPGALECFRRATAILESYAPAHYQMGRALQRLGQHEASRAAFARAQQLNPSLLPPK